MLSRIIGTVMGAVFVGGITKGKTSFHAGVPFIGLAVFVRGHADNLIALHFGFK